MRIDINSAFLVSCVHRDASTARTIFMSMQIARLRAESIRPKRFRPLTHTTRSQSTRRSAPNSKLAQRAAHSLSTNRVQPRTVSRSPLERMSTDDKTQDQPELKPSLRFIFGAGARSSGGEVQRSDFLVLLPPESSERASLADCKIGLSRSSHRDL